jgi:hypothetical protein
MNNSGDNLEAPLAEVRNNPAPNSELLVTDNAINLGSAALIEARQHVAADEDFVVEVVELAEGGPSMRLIDGTIQLDHDTHKMELANVYAWLLTGIGDGDQHVLAVYLRNIVGEDDEALQLRQKLITAFENQDTSGLELNELTVNIVTAGIAERNMIRNGIRPELAKQPVHFKDKTGKLLTGDDDLDVVIAKDPKTSDTFKLIVGSRRGIETIHIPQNLQPDQFTPAYDKVSKDDIHNVVSIPLKAAADRTRPSISVIEVHIGPVEIVQALAQQEREARAEQDRAQQAQERQAEREREREKQHRATYSPPPPRPTPGKWTSYSG